MSRSKPSSSSSSSQLSAGDTLCCCEYENWKGERSHILACCCDCEAVDETFDKIFKCERVSSSTIDRVLLTISDRLRIPMISGGKGATKLRPDAVVPAVLVPTLLCLATLHPVMTVLSFLAMPVSMGIFMSIYRRQNHQRRTIFFFSWALTSLITSYIVFQVFVVAFREVLLWEILLVFTMTITIFRLLYKVKKEAALLKVTSANAKQRGAGGHKRTHSNVTPQVASGMLYDQVTGQEVASGHRFYDNNDASTSPTSTTSTTVNMSQDGGGQQVDPNIHWVDSRSPQDHMRGETYCDVCRIHKPPRAGHCPRCQICVLGRDHHCVWIDSCVGTTNHRQFLAVMILFVVTGLYGVHLTMTTICTPVMLFDWFLFPNDCRWLYIDFLTSICFVTAIYSCMFSCLVLMAMTMQLVLISQNMTGQEFVRATRLRITTCLLYNPMNPYNKGFFQNWFDFLFSESRGGPTPSELPL